ncbi:hypothetical protein CQW23_12049 [Capsicum baccatum]|uniref:Polygalacturonase n=1 Tax=Capsicum baccatum TaxID=33114 RepID=A0A2G2WRM5_CAPBA|nr:hypothetical protein CQW23_12049 [Capsicum baccatum]
MYKIMMRILISFFLALLLPSLIFSDPDSPVFNVLDYGAVGNGYNDSTSAFNLTWAAACTSSSSSPTMYVPSDNTFLLHPLMLRGPCLSPDITIVINGTIIPPYRGWRWRWIDTHCIKWICIKNVNGLSVRGSGRIIYGEPPEWWEVQDRMRPTSLMPLPKIIATQVFEIAHSKNISLSGLKFMDSHNTSVHLNNVTSARIFNITIAESSYNADGIHVSGSKDVTIDHCRIATVGDCISIVDGSFNLKISNIVCGTGGGISVGKLGSTGNIENIVVSDVVFINTRNGAQIKTMGKVSKGHVRNINFERILLQDSRNRISINQFYCGYERCSEHKSDVQVSDITFREIFGTCKGESAVQLVCRTSLHSRI